MAFQRINIGGNFTMGTISTDIGQLSTLKGFFVQGSTIQGTLSTDLGEAHALCKLI